VQLAVQERHRPARTVDVLVQQFRGSRQALTPQKAMWESRLQGSASPALAATLAAGFCFHAADRRARKRPRLTGPWPYARRSHPLAESWHRDVVTGQSSCGMR
jgi:hypothetical protein